MQDVVEEKDGKKIIVQKKILPSYIFIKMIYGDDIWHAVTRTRGVTGFAGPKGRPLPLSEDEIRQMHLEDIECTDVQVGDTIEIVNGQLAGCPGTVMSVDYENKTCKVNVIAFGRDIESSKQVWSSICGYPGDPNYREFYKDIGYELDWEYIKPYVDLTGFTEGTYTLPLELELPSMVIREGQEELEIVVKKQEAQ